MNEGRYIGIADRAKINCGFANHTYSTVLKKVNISLAKFASEIYASCEYAKQLDSVLILARKRARISIRKNFSSIAILDTRYAILHGILET